MNLTKEDLQRIVKEELEAVLDEKWSEKYKRSIDCKNPKGFSQRAHCDGRKKDEAKAYHWDEPDWHYDGGYGDPEGPDSKWYMTEEELEEKKRKLTYKPGSESSLRDWFGRKGAKGKKKGWVDCNAPDGKGGYKSCGRGEGEKRKKYPACRPTPGACKKMKGSKGKSWGKKAKKGKKG